MKISFSEILERLKNDDASLTKIDARFYNAGTAGARALAEALKTNTSLTSLYVFNNNIDIDGITALTEVLKNNFTLCEIDHGIDLAIASKTSLDRSMQLYTLREAALARNKQLREARQTAATALKTSRKPASIPNEEIQETREAYRKEDAQELTEAEVRQILQRSIRIKTLKEAIENLQKAQHIIKTAISENKEEEKISESAQKMLNELKSLLKSLQDQCVFRITQLHIEDFQSNIEKEDALESLIEAWRSVPEDSIFFSHARIEAFLATYNQYRLEEDETSSLQAFVQALPLLQKEDRSLFTNFVALDKNIKTTFNLGERSPSEAFDFTLQEIAAGKDFSEARKNLQPEERLALLQFGLLRYLKNVVAEKESKEPQKTDTQTKFPFFKSTTKEEMTPLEKTLGQIPEKFDETNETQRNSIKECFNDVCEALEKLPLDKLEKNERTQDLKSCKNLMDALQKTTHLQKSSEQPASAISELGKQ